MAYETQDGFPTLGDPNSTGGGAGGGGAIEIQDEGNPVATVNKLNIVGKDIEAIYYPAFNRIDIVQTRGDFISIEAGRNSSNVNDSYLTGADGIFMNLSPFVVPFDGVIDAVILAGKEAQSWQVEVYKNAGIIAVPNQADAILTASISGSLYALYDSLNVPVAAGDRIAVYMRGNGINHPRVNLFLKRT